MANRIPGPFIGCRGERLDEVRTIAVLRGGGLGDLMFAWPAMTALAAAYPQARITLLGTPAHRALLEGRPGPVDEVVVLPYAEGVRPGPDNPVTLEAFRSAMRGRHFDLAVQLHGGGRYSNPFLLDLGARHTVGTRTPDAADLDRTLPYVYYQHEMLRALEVVGLVGASVVDLEPRLTVTGREQEVGRSLLGTSGADHPVLVIHPGATDPRRRWPADHFAELARQACAAGWQVTVVGDGDDRDAAARIVAAVPGSTVSVVRDGGDGAGRAFSVAGELTLPELLGVLGGATVMVGNDSGPRHLAAAVGIATVGLYWIGNCINAGPLGRGRHRVHLSWTTRCPVCDVDVTQVGWTAERCGHDPSFIGDIPVSAVWADVEALASGE